MTLRIDPSKPLPLSLFADPLIAAVVISLFSDARAGAEYIGDPRGWWGDELSPLPDDKTGSLLWLFARAKNTPETLRVVEDTASTALQWLIDDRVVDAVTVAASPRRETLCLSVALGGVAIEFEVKT